MSTSLKLPSPTPMVSSWIPRSASRRIIRPGRRVGQADVGHAIGQQDHPVDTVVIERLVGEVVAQLEAASTFGRAAGSQVVDGVEDVVGVIDPGGVEHDARVVVELDDGDVSSSIELVDELLERLS